MPGIMRLLLPCTTYRGTRSLPALALASAIFAVAAYVFWSGLSLFFTAGQAHLTVWIKSWEKPWTQFDLDHQLFKGTADCVAASDPFMPLCSHGAAPCYARRFCTADGASPSPQGNFYGFGTGAAAAPQLGSYEALGLDGAKCLDRTARTRYFGSSAIDASGKDGLDAKVPSWDNTVFASLQEQCTTRRSPAKPRTAIVIRAWDGFRWTADDMVNIRAMFAQLILHSGGDYQLFVLLHIRDPKESLPKAGETSEDVKARYVPKELVSSTELWSYTDVEAAYPAVGEYDVYYHNFMGLQLFAESHPEFDFFWNWEVDVRYTGDYRDLFVSTEDWARKQPIEGLWERNKRFYIPSFHGSYDSFARAAEVRGAAGDARSGEAEADLISLFPLFDIGGTVWPHRRYILNYNKKENDPPPAKLYGTVGTNFRFSRKMLRVMHEENLAGHAMMTEMWPPTLAAHHSLKAVVAPHPVFLDRQWTGEALQHAFNAGPNGQVGGSSQSVINQEPDFEGSTWFWNSKFGVDLYRRWLGLASDGVGSPQWEQTHGPLCLPGVLLHPVKSNLLSRR